MRYERRKVREKREMWGERVWPRERENVCVCVRERERRGRYLLWS